MGVAARTPHGDRAHELDAEDPLGSFREHFLPAPGVLAYFDGNSLGRPLRATRDRLAGLVDTWSSRLIRGWDESWMALPETVGDRIGALTLGAAPGQVVVADSTTVVLYKLLRAALAARPGRNEIVIDDDNFPTDRFVVQAVAAELGLTVRWLRVDRHAGVEVDQVEEAVGDRTAVVLLSHISYRSSHLADAEAITAVAHDAGALVLWDVCHSVGSVPLDLDAWGVDLAVGCTYKYLGGGPGSPAFAYVRDDLQDVLEQPIAGWMGSAAPFDMGPRYEPAAGIRRFLSGTPSIVAMHPMQDMLDVIEQAGMVEIRKKSMRLTQFVVEIADSALASAGVTLATTRDPARRGGHVTLEHPEARAATARAWERGVIPDFRGPYGIRIGPSPLSTSFAEVAEGLAVLEECLQG
ncbi:MAG: aminotransferase class V-fold PLP-dependent enzyme [Naasia sp.]|jgi:kynureninase|uniref:kynureninase n=1 Tax=Naasia sp. TaxID=2546198 RepID=UPI002626AF70|nr:kynureninase [Naasia sp.]MCU1570808.1 aminotransferase class V-fold PLP-dependent enzyme [Naasia sp.]